MRVVFAPDSFKGSISAAAAADALAQGWRSVRPGDEAVLLPMADGGEGTREAFSVAVAGSARQQVSVLGPDGELHVAPFQLLAEDTAFIDLASTSGIELLQGKRLPFDAHTFGFGQAIAAALDAGATRLLLGIGSSASTDLGSGLLTALGARFLDAAGAQVPLGLRGLRDVVAVDLSGLRPQPAGGVVVLSDVDNPLTGPTGAACVFGPQKGLDPQDLGPADETLAHVASLLGADATAPGAGAAGGTGCALQFWGAEVRAGAAEVARLIGLPEAVATADLVITGEGRFDQSSAHGKVPARVARLAGDTPTALVAGALADGADVGLFATVVVLTDLAGGADAAMAEPARWLRAAGAALAR